MFTPTFRVEYRVAGSRWTPAIWRTKEMGNATPRNLARHVAAIEASTQPGGPNAHLGATTILAASIVRQATRDVVAEYVAPAAEVAA